MEKAGGKQGKSTLGRLKGVRENAEHPFTTDSGLQNGKRGQKRQRPNARTMHHMDLEKLLNKA